MLFEDFYLKEAGRSDSRFTCFGSQEKKLEGNLDNLIHSFSRLSVSSPVTLIDVCASVCVRACVRVCVCVLDPATVRRGGGGSGADGAGGGVSEEQPAEDQTRRL